MSAGGKVTFAANDDTLAEKLIALNAEEAAGNDVVAGEAVFFEDSGNTYIFFQGVAAADDLIQITGVTGLTTLTEGTGAPLALALDSFSFA